MTAFLTAPAISVTKERRSKRAPVDFGVHNGDGCGNADGSHSLGWPSLVLSDVREVGMRIPPTSRAVCSCRLTAAEVGNGLENGRSDL